MKRANSDQIRAFTLVEMLAALAILAILLVLFFPSVSRIIAAGKTAQCVSNLRQMGSAISVYTAEHNGEFPPGYSSPGIPGTTVGERDWYQFLWHSSPDKLDNAGVLPNPNYPANDPRKLTVYQCPANSGRIWYWNTPNYAYSQALGYTLNDFTKRAKASKLQVPSKTILLVDAGFRYSSPLSRQDGPADVLCYLTTYSSSTFNWQTSVNFLHGGRANFLLADGHVESLTRETVADRGANKSLLWSPDNTYSSSSYW